MPVGVTPAERADTERAKAALHTAGFAAAQQQIVTDRTPQFWAAVHGTFDVVRADAPGVVCPPDEQIADGAHLEVRWRHVDAATGAVLSRGVAPNIVFHNGASLAAELSAMALGAVDEWRFVNGGWLYLIGEPPWFWSAMIMRRQCGGRSIVPAPGPGLSVDEHTQWGRERARLHSAPGGVAGMLAGLQFRSRSMAAAAVLPGLAAPFTAEPSSLEPGAMPGALPACDEDRPSWWVDVDGFWGSQLERCVAAGRAPCMFYITEAGCRPGEAACAGVHDKDWAAKAVALKEKAGAAR